MANTLNLGNGNWATKEDSLLAYNSENGNFKPLPFDFTRASSGTVVNKDGLIETVGSGEPRIDFKDNTKGALLLEPQRTNSLLQSNQFDTTWQISAAGVSVNPNQVGVGNSQDAWKLTEGNYNGEHFIRQTPNIGGVVSISVYAKAGTNDFLYIRGVNSGLNRRTWFNLSTGTVGTNQGISAEMISMGDGWYRCVMVLDHQTAFEYYIAVSNADGVSSYQGSNNYIYIQNSQLEQGSYATSYIPTSGSAVTRSADATIGNLPSSSIGQSEGVVYFEGSYLDTSEQGYIQISDGTSDNRIIIWNLTSTLLRGYIVVGGAEQAQITGGIISNNTTFKVALKYKTNDFALWFNGVEVGVDPFGSTFGSNVLNKLDLQISSVVFEGEVKDLKLYNTALTNAELQALTTI